MVRSLHLPPQQSVAHPASELHRQLDAARLRGDALADVPVAVMGGRAWAINAQLAQLHDDDAPLPVGLSDVMKQLARPALPAWADMRRIRSAQRFADRHLPAITLALFCASLPSSYLVADGAKLLLYTRRMKSDLDRRINETAQFVLDVLQPHAFESGGRGRTSVGKVRLIHASVRSAARKRCPTDALPINQEDMLGTLGLFSLLVLDSIQRLDVVVSSQDEDDFLHLWCVVGAMLGIEEGLLPHGVQQARALFATIRRRRHSPSPAGRELMAELLRGMERHMLVPDAPRLLIHHLLGTQTATELGCGLPERRGFRGVLGALAMRSITNGELSALLPRLGRPLLEGFTRFKLGGQRASLPMALR